MTTPSDRAMEKAREVSLQLGTLKHYEGQRGQEMLATALEEFAAEEAWEQCHPNTHPTISSSRNSRQCHITTIQVTNPFYCAAHNLRV